MEDFYRAILLTMKKSSTIKIFLSGDTYGSWREIVIESLKDLKLCLEFFDPRTLSNKDMETIARTERSWLDKCDCLFFYFDPHNPSGIGSAFEVGYCVAKGIPVIFVDGKKTSHSKWLGIHCDHVLYSLNDGISVLKDVILKINNKRASKKEET
jgi:nucleoside 2-deoxyribosyltransferase